MAFLGAVSSADFVAPVRGQRRLADYFRELAAGPFVAPLSGLSPRRGKWRRQS